MAAFSIHGDIIWTEEFGSFRYAEGGYLTVDEGKIVSVSSECPADAEVIDMEGRLVFPGLSDLHLHAPQYAFMGLYMDEELLEWLNKHTFPEEAKYKDAAYAEKAYSILADDLLHGATTRVSVFGTIHTNSTLLLMRKLEEAGLSGCVGKVAMDRNSPDILIEDTDESIRETERFVRESSAFRSIRPSITPRFVPSCSDRLLRTLGEIASEYDLPVQSHLDENLSEISWVQELCPWSANYADVYRAAGLLGRKTIMAHCVWLNDKEMEMLRNTGTFIAHAPSSNRNLSSGIAPMRKYLEYGISAGLSTDVAGGSSISMLRMIEDAIGVSKLLWRSDSSAGRPLTFPEAFYLASKGGGAYFGSTGSFEPGYDADIVVFDDSVIRTVLRPCLSVPERLELLVYRAPESRAAAKFVKGRRIL